MSHTKHDLRCYTQGAVYVTNNAAYSWTAAVQESVDATLNRTVSSGAPHSVCVRCRNPLQSQTGLLYAAHNLAEEYLAVGRLVTQCLGL